MFDETGCAGVSIGRGAFYDPWIFQRTTRFLATGEAPPEPDFNERLRVMRRHLDLMVEVFGETHGSVMFRKIGPWYAKRFGPVSVFNKRIVQLASRAQFEEIVADYVAWRRQFLDGEGKLLPKFAPAPLASSFMEEAEPAAAQRASIPVPKGPVDVW